MNLSLPEIQIRDPFVVPRRDEGAYYLFGTTDRNPWSGPGTGFDCYRSGDLLRWEGPVAAFRPAPGFWATTQFWAPEVHAHRGRWYMFASFKAPERPRGTQILVAGQPAGPYAPWSDGPVTPGGWECLDGTLHIDEQNQPWIVFCHEWLQIQDGAIYALRLSPDLREAVGEPALLFRASAAPWVAIHEAEAARPGAPSYVTDGPFLHRTGGGTLLMLWSSSGPEGYAMGLARSVSGTVLGPWIHDPEPLWKKDGGHGMIFRAFDGRLLLTIHAPNITPQERAILLPVVEEGDTVRLAS